jgi:hypothetical protein
MKLIFGHAPKLCHWHHKLGHYGFNEIDHWLSDTHKNDTIITLIVCLIMEEISNVLGFAFGI